MNRPLLITGPTASGKSAYALTRAAERPSVVINCDCMQVYRDLAILTARPTPADEARISHALYGFVDASEAYSVGRYVEDVKQALTAAEQTDLRPIVVGGTGLYFMALLRGLSPIPPVPGEIREYWRSKAEQQSAGALHACLAVRDEVMAARLSPGDTQRVTRALEVLDATGQSLSIWQNQPGQPVLREEECERIIVMRDRKELYARAESRFDAMMAAGVMEEVAQLGARNLDPALPIMRAHGIRELLAARDGRCHFADAIEHSKTQTRHYIKRQMVWLRKNMIAWGAHQAQ